MRGAALAVVSKSPNPSRYAAVREGIALTVVADRSRPPMHPDDLERIIAALGRAQPPTVAAMTGADAEMMRRFIASEVEKGLERIYEKIDSFLPDAEIEKRIVNKFERIGLRVDDDHYEETGNAIRGFMKWHKRSDKVLGGIAISILGAIVLALLKMVGINVPAGPN